MSNIIQWYEWLTEFCPGNAITLIVHLLFSEMIKAETVDFTRLRVECYHCGADCPDNLIREDEHVFCCEGCRLVYDLLKENNLCTYYSLEKSPGIKNDSSASKSFEVLDRDEIRSRFIKFEEGERARVIFRAEAMHCTSCIWLLEHLNRFNKAIISSEVNFPDREVTIDFNPAQISLSKIAGLLTEIGYAPSLTMNDIDNRSDRKWDNRILKIGIAGFCFGNIMMLSFPDYLGASEISSDFALRRVFSLLSLGIALPTLLYSGSTFFVSAWKSIRFRSLNIDAPIALAIAVTFLRSVYEIWNGNPGYLDSMSGIIFFMLLGRYFQDRTFQRMNFERDYKSYFPIAVTVVNEHTESSVPVTELKKGDRMFIRTGELIPTDAILLEERAYIDYSFVTGESEPVRKMQGDKIYAGARQTGSAANYEVAAAVSSGYLTRLWNKDVSATQAKAEQKTYIDTINRYFSAAVILCAALGGIAWLFIDPAVSMNVVTAVLIVACPCTLLLASTFTNGSAIRVLADSGLFLKSAASLEKLSAAEVLVFDKTGTITGKDFKVHFVGSILSQDELNAALQLALQSGHPLSRRLVSAYGRPKSLDRIKGVREVPGKGISGEINGVSCLLGSASFCGDDAVAGQGSAIWFAINGKVKGHFVIQSMMREGLGSLISRLRKTFSVQLLSGDNANDRKKLEPIFGKEMYFGKSPVEKMDHIQAIQASGKKVIMIGDGLNDSGAMTAASAGIAVSDDTNSYFPACDAILDGRSFYQLDRLLSFTGVARKIVYATFVFSLLYNCVGIYYSLTGQMSPLIAAILMPVSTFTIILLTTLGVRISSSFLLKRLN